MYICIYLIIGLVNNQYTNIETYFVINHVSKKFVLSINEIVEIR